MLLLLSLASACEAAAPPAGSAPVVPPEPRPSDGILGRPDLQQVVELQVARDARALVERLAAPDPAVRARAALALGSVQAVEAVEPLASALDDPEAAVRRDAAFALGQAESVEAVAPLARALAAEGEPGVRGAILDALGRIPDTSASEALLAAGVRNGEEAVRSLALARLGAVHRIVYAPAREHLLSLLDAPDAAVREAAAYYFGRQPEPGLWFAAADRVRAALDAYAPDDAAAVFLVQALGRVGDPAEGARLRRWAREGVDWRVRTSAMVALGGRETEAGTLDVLLAGLDDPSIHVAVSAARSLARGTYEPSTLARVERWIDGHPGRWQAAAPLLVLLVRQDEREYVLDWLGEIPPDDEARWRAGFFVANYIRGREPLELLLDAARSPSEAVAAGAVGALAARWSGDRANLQRHASYFEAFRAAVRSGNEVAAALAATPLADPLFHALGSVGTLAAALRGMSAPEETEAIVAVLDALALAGGEEAEAALRGALDHPEPEVRGSAVEALARLTGDVVAPGAGPEARGGAGRSARAAGEGPPPIDWGYLASLGAAPRLEISTDRGDFTLRLVPEEAPLTVQTVARLAEAGRYDGVPFHRVVPNFVVQGGDVERGDGSGGPGFRIVSELGLVPFVRGVAGMASSGKDTEGSQFFVTHTVTPHLDGGFTAFGWVVDGMEVVDALAEGDRILEARVIPSG